MIISYEIYETRQRVVSLISYEMTICVRSSIYEQVDFKLPSNDGKDFVIGMVNSADA